MEERDIPLYLVFVGHEYLQRAERGWRGRNDSWFHAYLIQSSYVVEDGVAFSYGVNIAVWRKAANVKET